MPVAPYAAVLVSVNGGAPQHGGIEAKFGDTLQLYAESTIGWGIPAAVWEITTYPAGWPPPPGWSVDPVTKAYAILGNISSLPPFALPAASTNLWGKWKFRLRVNGGGGALTDASTAAEIVSPNGVHDLAAFEDEEFGDERGWPGPQQENLRLLDKAVGSAGSTLVSVGAAAPLEVTGPSNAPVLGIALVTPSTDGAMLHQDKAKLDSATPNLTAGTLVERDSVGGSTFQVVAVQAWLAFAQAGTFNISQAQAANGAGAQGSIRAQQGAAGQSGGPLLLGGGDAGTPGLANTWAGATQIQLGQLDAATQSSAALQLLAGPTGAFLTIACKGGAAVLTLASGLTVAAGGTTLTLAPGGLALTVPLVQVSVTTSVTFVAGGSTLALTPAGLALTVPLIQVANAQAPAAKPASGVYLYAQAGAWKAQSAAGVVTTMAPAGTLGPTLQLLDTVTASLKTNNSASQVLLAYGLPANVLLELDASIHASNVGNGNGSWFRRIVRVKRGTGAPVLKPVVTPVPDTDETGGLTVTAVLNGGSVELHVTGVAGLNFSWFVVARVNVFGP